MKLHSHSLVCTHTLLSSTNPKPLPSSFQHNSIQDTLSLSLSLPWPCRAAPAPVRQGLLCTHHLSTLIVLLLSPPLSPSISLIQFLCQNHPYSLSSMSVVCLCDCFPCLYCFWVFRKPLIHSSLVCIFPLTFYLVHFPLAVFLPRLIHLLYSISPYSFLFLCRCRQCR